MVSRRRRCCSSASSSRWRDWRSPSRAGPRSRTASGVTAEVAPRTRPPRTGRSTTSWRRGRSTPRPARTARGRQSGSMRPSALTLASRAGAAAGSRSAATASGVRPLARADVAPAGAVVAEPAGPARLGPGHRPHQGEVEAAVGQPGGVDRGRLVGAQLDGGAGGLGALWRTRPTSGLSWSSSADTSVAATAPLSARRPVRSRRSPTLRDRSRSRRSAQRHGPVGLARPGGRRRTGRGWPGRGRPGGVPAAGWRRWPPAPRGRRRARPTDTSTPGRARNRPIRLAVTGGQATSSSARPSSCSMVRTSGTTSTWIDAALALPPHQLVVAVEDDRQPAGHGPEPERPAEDVGPLLPLRRAGSCPPAGGREAGSRLPRTAAATRETARRTGRSPTIPGPPRR